MAVRILSCFPSIRRITRPSFVSSTVKYLAPSVSKAHLLPSAENCSGPKLSPSFCFAAGKCWTSFPVATSQKRRIPSLPNVANRPVPGWKLEQVTGTSGDPKVRTRFPVAESSSQTCEDANPVTKGFSSRSSLKHPARNLPSGEKAIPPNASLPTSSFLITVHSARCFPVAASTRTIPVIAALVVSLTAAANFVPSGEKITSPHSPQWSWRTSRPVSRSQTNTSEPQQATCLPSGESANPVSALAPRLYSP